MKFSEIKYVRPDMDKLKAEAESAADRIKNAANADEAANAYLDWDKAAASFATMNSLCYIRHTINTEDKFYDEENEFSTAQTPISSSTHRPLRRSLQRALSAPSWKRSSAG